LLRILIGEAAAGCRLIPVRLWYVRSHVHTIPRRGHVSAIDALKACR
jgi:hypothetical protein